MKRVTVPNSNEGKTYLHPGVDSDEVGGVLLDVVPERAGDVVGDVEEHGEPHEGLQVEGGGLVAEEELLLAEQLGEDAEVLLAHRVDLLVGVAAEAGGLQLLRGLKKK